MRGGRDQQPSTIGAPTRTAALPPLVEGAVPSCTALLDQLDVQRSMLNVFHRDGETIRHFWGSELLYAPTDPGQHPRHVDAIEPLWNLYDLTPIGRGTDWGEQLSYCRVSCLLYSRLRDDWGRLRRYLPACQPWSRGGYRSTPGAS